MNVLRRRLIQDCPRLIASIVFSTLAAGVLAAAAHAGRYVDLRRIEPISGDVARGASKTTVCVACHGPSGNSIVPQFPSLASQRAEYLYHRLVAFKAVNPKDPNYASSPMAAQAQNLSDQDMRNLAMYFAAQAQIAPVPPPAAAVDGRGAALYLGGDPSRGVPPCQGCHGASALGGPVGYGSQYLAYPLLRGQHAAYLVSRLSSFRNGLPNGSSNDFIMHGVALTLDDGSIQSLAGWLESLPPATAK
ncbi:MAG TPA: c-type cytochrome [Steroidobacteraceae bacterium]|nr:c-type cytochrome [Steroidobacteraceae bacterium]